MGMTLSSFRFASVEEEKEWKQFGIQYDKPDRKAFVSMFATCLFLAAI